MRDIMRPPPVRPHEGYHPYSEGGEIPLKAIFGASFAVGRASQGVRQRLAPGAG